MSFSQAYRILYFQVVPFSNAVFLKTGSLLLCHAQLLEELNVNKDLQKLRERRNAIIHVDLDNPAITMDQQIANREELEKEARSAVKLMFEAFYLSPGT